MQLGQSTSNQNWCVNELAQLDFHYAPGLLAQIFRSTPHRQQVVAAILAIRSDLTATANSSKAAQMAQELAKGRLATLLQNWLPSRPPGLLGALARMIEVIEEPSYYKNLIQVYSDPDLREVARALRHIRGLNSRTLSIVLGASPSMLRSGGWQLAKTTSQLGDLVIAIDVIQEISGADDREISRSLTAALAHGSVTRFVRSLLGQARLPPSPDIRHPMITQIVSASELRRESLAMENCMGGEGFLLDILCGKEAFYIADSPVFGRMIARIGHEDIEAPWELLGVHLKQNRTPSYAASEWVREQFADAGIKHQRLRRQRGAKFAAIERLLDPVIHDLDDMMADWVP